MVKATMKAAVVHEFGKPLLIEEVPVPSPGPGEVLIQVKACGVCHTDLHAAAGDWPVKPSMPFIPGHEAAGIVVALGAGVSERQIGDTVGVPWLHDACMRCEYCETGWETLCEKQHNTGYSCNGGFAEYVIASAPFAARLPADIDFNAIAPILCAGVTTYKGLKETEARPGEWVAISGIGGLGNVAIQYAKAMGLNIVAIDIAPDKLELARHSGADVAVDARSVDAVAEVIEATKGGAHGILVTVVSPPRLLPGAADGPPQRHCQPRRSAARRVCDADLRCRAEAHHGAGVDRGHAARPRRGDRLRNIGQGPQPDHHGETGRHQRHL